MGTAIPFSRDLDCTNTLLVMIDVTKSHTEGYFAEAFGADDCKPLWDAAVEIGSAANNLPFDTCACVTHFGHRYPENAYGLNENWLTDDDALWNVPAVEFSASHSVIKPNDHVVDAPGFRRLIRRYRNIIITGFTSTCCISYAVLDIIRLYPGRRLIIPLNCIAARLSKKARERERISEWRKAGVHVVERWQDFC